MKLTKRNIDALSLPGGKGEAIFFDDDLAGFGLRLRHGGSRKFIYQYKLGDKHRRVTIGGYPAIRPEDARDTAANLYAKVRLGQDPAGEKVEGRARAAETFEAAIRSFLSHQKLKLKPRSYVELERHLLKHAKPLHGLQLAAIDRRTIAARLTALAGHGPSAVNRTRASLSAFFAWAIRQGMIDNNPVTGTGTAVETGDRDRVLKADEIRAIWNALPDDQYGGIVRLLALTGQRRDEIGGLRRSEINFDAATITLPPERTKNKREHVVPLSAPALAILKAQLVGDRDLVFGIGSGGFSGWSKAKQRLDALLGTAVAAWRLHDWRRTCATGMGEIGVEPHEIEGVLNHVSGHKAGVAGTYNRAKYERQKRAALDRWAEHLLAIVEGRDSNVVPLRTA